MIDQRRQSMQDKAKALLIETFGDSSEKLCGIHAPGRSEISGNHTDHQGGHVIAGALDVSIEGVARLNNSMQVNFASAGYAPFSIDLSDLEVKEDEKNTTASLVRGMAWNLVQLGATPAGFDIALTCDVPAGGGLSSSAAVEAAIGRAMETLWGLEPAEPLHMAQMSQHTENVYFGKPCGLMDQASVCLGGLAYIKFEDPKHPVAQKLDYSFDDNGYALVLVNVGSDHANLSGDYAAIPGEIKEVSKYFGKERLCDVDEKDFLAAIPELRKIVHDRALLRSLHFYRENHLVDKRWDALNANDIEAFLTATEESGASSAMFLQNVSLSHDFEHQAAMLSLALAESQLDGKGAVRIHGGGFGGSIQCFVPLDQVDAFIKAMDAFLGEGSARHFKIEEEGAFAQWI